MTAWCIYSHVLADTQVAIILGFILHIVVPGPGQAI